jgi:SAM-dependent methyltransferase
MTDDQRTLLDGNTQYHLSELEIALDPSRPEHIQPDLSLSRVGVVDVGCGVGQLFVANAGELGQGVRCHGFDIDRASIEYANEHWPERAQFSTAPAEALPLPDRSVDLYVSRVTLPYTDIPAALNEAARVLIPGGRLWITLHPVSMTLGEMKSAMLKREPKEFVRRTIVLLNGLTFHLFGTRWHLFGVRDSWQSVTRMKKELARAFTDIRATINQGQFLTEARRR